MAGDTYTMKMDASSFLDGARKVEQALAQLRAAFGQTTQTLEAFTNAARNAQNAMQGLRTSTTGIGTTINGVRANFNNFNTSLQATQQRLTAVQQVTTNITANINRATSANKGFLLSWQSIARFFEARVLFNSVQEIYNGITEGTQRAAEFELVLGRIRTLAPDLAGGYNEWGESVKRISRTFGVDATDAAKSYYTALSNQIGNSIQEIEAFTRTTAQFSRVTGATAEQGNNLFSSAINAFQIKVGEADVVASKFFKAIDLGRITAEKMSGSFGRVAVAASTMGVSIDETLAALSTLSRQGVTDADAMTQVLNLFNKLIKPSESLKELFKEWGYESGQAAIQAEDLTGVLARFDEELRTKGVARIGELVNDLRGMRGTLGLTGKGLQEFNRDLRLISSSQQDYNRAVQVTSETMGFQWLNEINRVKVAFTDMGQSIISVLVPVSQYVGGLTNLLRDIATAAAATGTALLLNFLKPAYGATLTLAAAMAGLRTAIVSTFAFITGPTGIIAAIAGFAVWRLTAESTASRMSRTFEEAYTTITENSKIARDQISRDYEQISNQIKKTFQTVLKDIGTRTADYNRYISELDANIAGLRRRVDDMVRTNIGAITEAISDLNARIRELDKLRDQSQTSIRKALAEAASQDFKFSIDELSNAKQALTFRERTSKLLADQLALARSGNLSDALRLEEEAENTLRNYVSSAKAAFSELKRLDAEIASVQKKLQKADEPAERIQYERQLIDLQAQRNELARDTSQINQARDLAKFAKEEAAAREQISQLAERERKAAEEQRTQLEGYQETLKAAFDELQGFLVKSNDNLLKLAGGPEAQLQRVAELVKTVNDAQQGANAVLKKPLGFDLGQQSEFTQLISSIRDRITAQSRVNELSEQQRRAAELQIENEKELKDATEKHSAAMAERDSLLARAVLLSKELSSVSFTRWTSQIQGEQGSDAGKLRQALLQIAEITERRQLDPTSVTSSNAQLSALFNQIEEITRRGNAYLTSTASSQLQELIGTEGALFGAVKAAETSNLKVQELKQNVVNLQEAFRLMGRSGVESTQSITASIRELITTLQQIPAAPIAAPQARAAGGSIRGTDSVHAMLSPGEFVVNAAASRKFYSQLVAMNSSNRNYSSGGSVTNVGDLHVSMQATGNTNVDATRLGRAIKREIKRGALKL